MEKRKQISKLKQGMLVCDLPTGGVNEASWLAPAFFMFYGECNSGIVMHPIHGCEHYSGQNVEPSHFSYGHTWYEPNEDDLKILKEKGVWPEKKS